MRRIALPYQADPCVYFNKLRQLNYPILFDSCAPNSHGRYDIMSANPQTTIITQGAKTIVKTPWQHTSSDADPLEILQDHLKPQAQHDLPFVAGALGYCAYELGQRFERLPHTVCDDIAAPDMWFGIYDWSIVTDHHTKTTSLCTYDYDLNLVLPLLAGNHQSLAPFQLTSEIHSNVSFDEYQVAFDRVMEHILAGDCYQANLSQRFSAKYQGDPWELYQRTRVKNPAPYAAFIDIETTQILSFSPELFLHVHDQQVTTKPIKGTRPRHTDPEQDQALANELLVDEKERAENLMIVDLLRNDLGRACKPGSIQVPKLFALESYQAVHHMVSTVVGELTDDNTSLDLLRQSFPGGSITGAPKIRAMEIIDEVEKHQRSIYCGSLVSVDHNGNLNSNIAIRTLLCENNQLYYSAGGAIVADSKVDAEYAETEHKVKLIQQSLKA